MRAVYLLIALASAWGQDTGSIEGVVTNSATHTPVANVRVVVDHASGPEPNQPHVAVTDVSGVYRVDQLAPRDYVVTFSANTYVATTSPVVHVSSATVRVNADLSPSATLHGRVLDDEGQPAAEQTVEIYRYRGGQPTTVKSDAEGRFDFPKVSSGMYAVGVRPAPKPKDGTALAPTWSPGVTDRAQAERVIVRPGAEVAGLEIRLRRVPVWTIEGTVSDEAGHALGGIALKLRPADEWQPDEASTVTSGDGAFHFNGVRPGEWRLSASGAGKAGFASVLIDKHDVERVAVRLLPPFALEGVVERDEPRDAEGKRKVSGVSLDPEGGQGKRELAFHQQDGAIRFPKVHPGRYTIFPLGYIPGYYLESVKLGDRDVMSRPVDLSDGAIPFRVIYRNNAGRVRGTVEKCSGSTVVLLPQDEALLDGQFIRTAKCDGSGRFEVGSLKPGEYYAFAFDRVDNSAFTDVTFVRNLRSLAASVHVEAGQAADVDLKVTPWPE
jgi:5-hydroxyisourate hydrolase-like protein (transthyretin family)